MTTSLPSSDALYHAQAKVFQRSAGRSAVAAAAYRSASCLTDDRIGQTFDYTKKQAVGAFIVAPENSPGWAFDRQKLWNNVELSEVRKNAVVAREWEISIPRDIPESDWEAFAKATVAPWIETGAVADIAIHCPPDVYGQPQPHLHIMLSTRALDATTESGFSKKKNDQLTRLFEAGGRHGEGKKADALKLERERIAGIMNEFLAQTGSVRRASHLSNEARGLEREPEPLIGETRKASSKRRKQGDRRTQAVGLMRKERLLENELIKMEEEIMRTSPQFQSPERDGIKPRRKQDYKQMLMSERLPDVTASTDKLHMIDVRSPKITRIQCRDGGWVEVQNRQATVYGNVGYADELAKEIMSTGHADHVTRLEETAALSKKGTIVKFPKPTQTSESSPIPESVVESLADKWRSRGFTNITEAPDGVWLSIGATRIQDLGNEVRIHGKASDPAIDAMLQKALDEWNSEIELYGSQEFKDKAWLQAQRLGVSCFDKNGKPFEPSAEIKKQYEADLAKMGTQAQEIEGIRERKKLTTLMREAASGNKESLSAIQQRDPYLLVFLTDHLDADQLKLLSNESDESLEKQLDGMREIGRETVKHQAASGGSSVNEPQDSIVEDDELETENNNENNPKPKI